MKLEILQKLGTIYACKLVNSKIVKLELRAKPSPSFLRNFATSEWIFSILNRRSIVFQPNGFYWIWNGVRLIGATLQNTNSVHYTTLLGSQEFSNNTLPICSQFSVCNLSNLICNFTIFTIFTTDLQFFAKNYFFIWET